MILDPLFASDQQCYMDTRPGLPSVWLSSVRVSRSIWHKNLLKVRYGIWFYFVDVHANMYIVMYAVSNHLTKLVRVHTNKLRHGALKCPWAGMPVTSKNVKYFSVPLGRGSWRLLAVGSIFRLVRVDSRSFGLNQVLSQFSAYSFM